MPTPAETANRIRQWAIAIGGEQMQRLGYAAIEAIRSHAPANDPDFDDAQAELGGIIARMADDGWAKEALVLEVHYLSEGLTEAERLQRLSRKGLTVSRAAYYIYLNTAHAYVSAALTFGDRNR